MDRSVGPGYRPGPEHLNAELERRDPPIRLVFNLTAGAYELQEWRHRVGRWDYIRFWASYDDRGQPTPKRLPIGVGPIVAVLHGAGVDENDRSRTTDLASYGRDPRANARAHEQAMRKTRADEERWARAEWEEMRRGFGLDDYSRRMSGRRTSTAMGGPTRSSRYVGHAIDAQAEAVNLVREKIRRGRK